MIIGDGSEKSSRRGPGEGARARPSTTGGADHSERAADVERIHTSTQPPPSDHVPSWSLGAVAIALASSPLLVASPAMALVATPLTLFALDFGLAAAMRLPAPRAPVRLFARAVAAVACAIFLRVLLTLSATGNDPAREAVAPFVVYGFAVFLSLTLTFAAYAATFPRGTRALRASGLAPPRPLGEATLVLLADLTVMVIALLRTRDAFLVGSLVVAATLCARGLFVAILARQVQKVPSSPSRVAAAFVVWIGVGAFAAMFARHERPLSGLGAAVLVTVALVGLEARKKLPDAVNALSRATTPWIVLAMLSVLSAIVR